MSGSPALLPDIHVFLFQGMADIGHLPRYINPARHVRAFGVGLNGNDWIDTFERWPR
jgi:hypothetical protein